MLARLIPLTLFAALVTVAQPASAQYFYWTAYSPLVTARPCCNSQTVTWRAAYPVTRLTAWSAPVPACCASPGDCCASGCSACAGSGCSSCCNTPSTTVTAGTASAVTGSATGTTSTSGLTQACKTCTIDDAKVLSGDRGLMYIDGQRGYFQMTWGKLLRTGDLQYTRQDEHFTYYRALVPGAAAQEPAREWAVARQGCAKCRYAVWTSYNEAGEKQWTKAHSADLQCVTPFGPPTPPAEAETRMKPTREEGSGRYEEDGSDDADGKTNGAEIRRSQRWETVPARTQNTKAAKRPTNNRLRFNLQSAQRLNAGWNTPATQTARAPH